MDMWNKYLDTLEKEKKEIVVRVLELARKCSPDAVAAMPYGVPGFKLNDKPLIAVAAHKNHYGIYPFSPKVIEKARPLIGGLDTAQGTIRFGYDYFPTEDLVKNLIEYRTQEIK